MAPLLKPFRALRYDVRRAGRPDTLVAPPYDVITPPMRERLLAASPYNAVRLIRPDDPAQAAKILGEWRESGVLVREDLPAVWVLEEEFEDADGVRRRRRGLVARVKLEPYSAGVVLPHERTFPGPKEARLRLLRSVRTKLSPILLLHAGRPPSTPIRDADLEATFEGARSRLWRIDDPAAIADATAAVRTPLVIADGHHRYETALRFHEEERSEETAYVLAVLVSRSDDGVVIFPTHRVAHGALPDLDGHLRLTRLTGGAAEAIEELARLPRERPAFVLLQRDGTVLAEAAESGRDPLGRLDAALIDALPLDDVSFTMSASDAERAVATGDAKGAFLVRAPTVEQVEAVALAGEKMPQKSTHFFPKLQSGLLFSPFDE